MATDTNYDNPEPTAKSGRYAYENSSMRSPGEYLRRTSRNSTENEHQSIAQEDQPQKQHKRPPVHPREEPALAEKNSEIRKTPAPPAEHTDPKATETNKASPIAPPKPDEHYRKPKLRTPTQTTPPPLPWFFNDEKPWWFSWKVK